MKTSENKMINAGILREAAEILRPFTRDAKIAQFAEIAAKPEKDLSDLEITVALDNLGYAFRKFPETAGTIAGLLLKARL